MKNGEAIFKETMVFSTNSVGKTGYSYAKKKMKFYTVYQN